MTAEQVVESLYLALLGRPPAGVEEISKVEHLEAGGSVADLVRWFLESPECCLWFYRNPVFDALTAPDPLSPETPRLYLWHLPKTGGSSLREMLRPLRADAPAAPARGAPRHGDGPSRSAGDDRQPLRALARPGQPEGPSHGLRPDHTLR
jgi:hypothetical protein